MARIEAGGGRPLLRQNKVIPRMRILRSSFFLDEVMRLILKLIIFSENSLFQSYESMSEVDAQKS